MPATPTTIVRSSRVLASAALGGSILIAVLAACSTQPSGASDQQAGVLTDEQRTVAQANIDQKAAKYARRGPKPFDKPQEAVDFFLEQRLAPGMDGYPIAQVEAVASEVNQRAALRRGPLPGGIQGWESIGPGNIGGRTRAIVINPVDPDIIYIGGVAGGVWKTTDGGASWMPTGDTLINLAISSIAMDPTDPDTLYAGTGEGVFNGDAVRGLGIFKSTDGAQTWTQLPSTANSSFFYVNQLKISPNDPSRIYAATRSGVWRSTDAGASFDPVLANPFEIGGSPASNGSFAGALDLDIQPGSNPDVLLATFGTFVEDGVWRSDDGGDSWTRVGTSSDVARFNQGRMNVEFAPSNPDVAYIAMADNGGGGPFGVLVDVFRSDDGGVTWSPRTNLGAGFNSFLFTNVPFASGCFGTSIFGQGWYDNAIKVDPIDEDIVWVGGIDLFRSDDGGQNFGLASYWYFDPADPNYVHADHHDLAFHPSYNGTTNQTLYSVSDGGIARTNNARAATSQNDCPFGSSDPLPTISWVQLNNGYATKQFYHGDSAQTIDRFVGGAQDNGTSRGNSTDPDQPWDRIFGGDGGYVAVDPTNPDIIYAETQNFPRMIKSVDGGASFFDATNGITDTDGLFITPFIMDQSDPDTLFTGGSRPWRTQDGANSWQRVGPNFDGPATISAIGIAPSDSDTVYLGFSDGYVVVSFNATSANPTWTIRDENDGLPAEQGFISWIAVDPTDPNTAYATSSTFGIDHIYKTTNAGASWTAIDGIGFTGVPDIPVHSIAIKPDDPQRLYAGTELGVFASDDGGTTWGPANAGMANTVVETLDFIGTDRLVAYTHGRSAFITEIGTATRLCAADVNADGVITDSDFFAWVTAFLNNEPECDVNEDGVCSDSDFFAWVVFFLNGCD